MKEEEKQLPSEVSENWFERIFGPLVEAIPNLPLKRTRQAFDRLCAGGFDNLYARIDRNTKSVETEAAARSLLVNELAQVAALKNAGDHDIVDRARIAWLPERIRKQENREAIFYVTIDELKENKKSEFQEEVRSDEEIDEDWLNHFSDYADKASSERMRDLWGRVLAGEIRRPGAFSLRTLGFMSEIDMETAKIFESISEYVINNDFIPAIKMFESGERFLNLVAASDAGLISSRGVSHTMEPKKEEVLFMQVGSYGFNVIFSANCKKVIGIYKLTRVGVEVLRFLRNQPDPAIGKQIANELFGSEQAVSQIVFGQIKRDAKGAPDRLEPYEILLQR